MALPAVDRRRLVSGGVASWLAGSIGPSGGLREVPRDAINLSRFGGDPTGRRNSAEAFAAALSTGRSVIIDGEFLLEDLSGNAFNLERSGQKIIGQGGRLTHDGSLCNLITLNADNTGIVGALQIVGAEETPSLPAQAIRIGTSGKTLSGIIVGDGDLTISGFGQGGIGGDNEGRLFDCVIHASISKIGRHTNEAEPVIYACDIKPAVGGAISVRGIFECLRARGSAALKVNNFAWARVNVTAVNGDQGACQFNDIEQLFAQVSVRYGYLPGYALSLNGVKGGQVDFRVDCTDVRSPVFLGNRCRDLSIRGHTSGAVQTLDGTEVFRCRVTVEAAGGILLGNPGASFSGPSSSVAALHV